MSKQNRLREPFEPMVVVPILPLYSGRFLRTDKTRLSILETGHNTLHTTHKVSFRVVQCITPALLLFAMSLLMCPFSSRHSKSHPRNRCTAASSRGSHSDVAFQIHKHSVKHAQTHALLGCELRIPQSPLLGSPPSTTFGWRHYTHRNAHAVAAAYSSHRPRHAQP